MKTRSFAALLAALLAAVSFAACSSPAEGPGSGAMAPVVTGIRRTFETGQFYGNWGNPTDGPGEVNPSMFAPGLRVLAPNPCVGKITLSYTLVKASTVRLWISPARLAGALGTESMFGANVAAAPMSTIKTLDSGSRRPAGGFGVGWDGTDDAGNRAPSGFYRIYLSVDGTMYWRDLLFFATLAEAERFSLKI